MNDINKIVDEIMQKQKIDGFSTEEFKILIRLKQSFEYSINAIDRILNDDDVISTLDDIVRDWNVNKHNRNNVIAKDMEILEESLKYLKSKQKDES